jgi:hypothetical protein
MEIQMKTINKTKIKNSARKIGKAVQLVDFDNKPTVDDYVAANKVNKFTRKFRLAMTAAGAGAGGWLGYSTMTKGLVGLLATEPMIATTTVVGALVYGTFFYGGSTAVGEMITSVVAERGTKAKVATEASVKKTSPRRNRDKIRPDKIKAAVVSAMRSA